jgi:hypothetical protein
MADGTLSVRTENDALRAALAAEHVAVWGYGVVGAALGPEGRATATASENAHRDVRDQLLAMLADRKTDLAHEQAAYTLPFPVLSAVDAATLAVVLEDGVATAWVRVLDQASERTTRELAVAMLSATEIRAVSWRAAAGKKPVTSALPGLPKK